MIKKAIVLNHKSIHQTVHSGDLIQITAEDQDSSFLAILDHINYRYGKKQGEEDNKYPYFIKNHAGDLINYAQHEISRQELAWFDFNKWTESGKKIFLGHICNEDINYIIAKKLIELDMGWSERDKITSIDLIGTIHTGQIKVKQHVEHTDYLPVMTTTKAFKLERKKE